MTQALAVARYTMLELTRRRLLVMILAFGVLLMGGIAIAPHVLPGMKSDQDRVIAMLTALAGVVPNAVTLCAFAVGMTVINHDLDSGAVISIFSKAVNRASYTAGKLLAAISLLLMIAAIFAVGSLLPMDRVPGASEVVDIWFWFAYVVAICAVLFWTVRRKQV